MHKFLVGFVIAACLLLLAPVHLWAQPQASEPGQHDGVTQALSQESAHVRWQDQWDRFRWWQYPTSVSLLGFGFASRYALPDPEPNWEGTFGLEQDLVDAIAVRDDPWRANLLQISNVTFFGSMAYRAIDSGLLPGLLHDNWDVAWQMSWIDLQAFGVVAGVLWGS